MAMMRVPGWRNRRRGIALLVTVIFMSVMLSFGVALASLAYKQSALATTATASQTAFYSADGALECALYADERQGSYIYGEYSSGNPPDAVALASFAAVACDGVVVGVPQASWSSGASGRLTLVERIAYNQVGGVYKNCADITIYKYAAPVGGYKAFIFSTGYNTSCTALGDTTARIVSRGLYQKY